MDDRRPSGREDTDSQQDSAAESDRRREAPARPGTSEQTGTSDEFDSSSDGEADATLQEASARDREVQANAADIMAAAAQPTLVESTAWLRQVTGGAASPLTGVTRRGTPYRRSSKSPPPPYRREADATVERRTRGRPRSSSRGSGPGPERHQRYASLDRTPRKDADRYSDSDNEVSWRIPPGSRGGRRSAAEQRRNARRSLSEAYLDQGDEYGDALLFPDEEADKRGAWGLGSGRDTRAPRRSCATSPGLRRRPPDDGGYVSLTDRDWGPAALKPTRQGRTTVRPPPPRRQAEPRSQRTPSPNSGRTYQIYRVAAQGDPVSTPCRDTACQWSEAILVEEPPPKAPRQPIGLAVGPPPRRAASVHSTREVPPTGLTYQEMAEREKVHALERAGSVVVSHRGHKVRMAAPQRSAGGANATAPTPIQRWVEDQSNHVLSTRKRATVDTMYNDVRRPPTFHGGEKESWHDWIQVFERVLEYTKCEDEYEITFRFQESLRDSALAYFNKLEKWQQCSWKEVKRAFEGRFGIRSEGERGRTALQQIKLKEGDTAASFCIRFEDAWDKAYPSHRIYPHVIDELVIDKFIEAINHQDAKLFLARHDPQTYADAKAAFQKFMRGNAWVLGSTWVRQAARVNQVSAPAQAEQPPPIEPGEPSGGANPKANAPTSAPKASQVSTLGKELTQELARLRQTLTQTQKDKPNRARNSAPAQKGGNRSSSNARGGRAPRREADARERQERSEQRKEYVLKTYLTPFYGKGKVCYYCGAPASRDHGVVNCPKRLRDEADNPGSTRAPGQASATNRSQQGN